METTSIAGDGVTLAVHDFGGGGDVLLVAHATGFLGPVYRAFAERLTGELRVVALDFRGHGDSSVPQTAEAFSWEHMASDVGAVLDWLDAPAVHGFGHSMGGAALLGAERARLGSLASAFLFEPIVPPIGGFAPSKPSLQEIARMRRATFASRSEALERYAARGPLAVLRADVLHDYVDHGFRKNPDGSVTLKCAPESEAATFGMGGSIHLGMLPDIALTTTVAMSGDGAPPAQLARVVADNLPNGTLLEFPDIGHFGPLQGPVGVARAVRAHMESLS